MPTYQRHEPVESLSVDYQLDGSIITQHFDDYGNHCIESGNGRSEWAPYQFVVKQGVYVGCTEYWDGTFPPVFKIEPANPLGEMQING